jgi:hypothetical protein
MAEFGRATLTVVVVFTLITIGNHFTHPDNALVLPFIIVAGILYGAISTGYRLGVLGSKRHNS